MHTLISAGCEDRQGVVLNDCLASHPLLDWDCLLSNMYMKHGTRTASAAQSTELRWVVNKKEVFSVKKAFNTAQNSFCLRASWTACQKEYHEKYSAVRNSELLRRGKKFIMYSYPHEHSVMFPLPASLVSIAVWAQPDSSAAGVFSARQQEACVCLCAIAPHWWGPARCHLTAEGVPAGTEF